MREIGRYTVWAGAKKDDEPTRSEKKIQKNLKKTGEKDRDGGAGAETLSKKRTNPKGSAGLKTSEKNPNPRARSYKQSGSGKR